MPVRRRAGRALSTTDPLEGTAGFKTVGRPFQGRLNAGPERPLATRFETGSGTLERTTRVTVDKLNRVTAVVDAISAQTQVAYDPNGRVLSLINALTHATG